MSPVQALNSWEMERDSFWPHLRTLRSATWPRIPTQNTGQLVHLRPSGFIKWWFVVKSEVLKSQGKMSFSPNDPPGLQLILLLKENNIWLVCCMDKCVFPITFENIFVCFCFFQTWILSCFFLLVAGLVRFWCWVLGWLWHPVLACGLIWLNWLNMAEANNTFLVLFKVICYFPLY